MSTPLLDLQKHLRTALAAVDTIIAQPDSMTDAMGLILVKTHLMKADPLIRSILIERRDDMKREIEEDAKAKVEVEEQGKKRARKK